MSKKLTNEVVDRRLLDECIFIKRLDNYINNSTHIRWECLVKDCGFIWSAIPVSILKNNKKVVVLNVLAKQN